MVTGTVTTFRETVLHLAVRGPGGNERAAVDSDPLLGMALLYGQELIIKWSRVVRSRLAH